MKLGPLQKKWVAALRSGDYHQGRKGYLLHSGSFCCLGVAAVAVLNKKPKGNWIDGSLTWLADYKSMGLRSETGSAKGNPENDLATLNDGDATFPEIAELLESQPELYFTRSV